MWTIVDDIAEAAHSGGILYADETASWSEIHRRARHWAEALAGLGIRCGARVGILADTGIAAVTAIQAVWLSGAAITVLPPPRSGNVARIAADAELDLILHGAGRSVELPMWTMQIERLNHETARAEPLRPAPDDLAILQYTSGSTRAPHAVRVTHAHLRANLDAIKAATRHRELHPGRVLSWLPLYHDMGLVGYLCLPMSCGCSLTLQRPEEFVRHPGGWLRELSRQRITASAGPNFAYALANRLLPAAVDLDLSSLRFLLTGAEPIDAVTMRRFAELTVPFGLRPEALVAGYGMAEATLAVTFSPMGAGLLTDRVDPEALAVQGRAVPLETGKELVRLGFPVPGVSVRVIGADEARVVGEIEVSGPSVAVGEGVWRTGDLGYLTEDGELVVCGRSKDVVFAAGRNVHPADAEAAAYRVMGVRTGGVAAFGVPGHDGERLIIAVELRGGDPHTVRNGVSAAVLAEIGLVPAAVVVLRPGRLPKTTSGKLRRAEIRRRYLEGALS